LNAVLKRLSLLAVAGLLASLVWTASVSGEKVSIYVPQAGHFSARPETLRFAYQPPGSYGEEETSGRGLYPPFKITRLNHWKQWREFPRAEATASGWLYYDSCKPNCLHGRYARVRAHVELDASFICNRGRQFWSTYSRITVKPKGMPSRKRFIQCTGRLRSGRRSTAIPAGVGFNR
jgi:hypothetical protein